MGFGENTISSLLTIRFPFPLTIITTEIPKVHFLEKCYWRGSELWEGICNTAGWGAIWKQKMKKMHLLQIWFSGKQALRKRLACRIFMGECSQINTTAGKGGRGVTPQWRLHLAPWRLLKLRGRAEAFMHLVAPSSASHCLQVALYGWDMGLGNSGTLCLGIIHTEGDLGSAV